MNILAVESADGSASLAFAKGDEVEFHHSGEMRDSLSWFMQKAESCRDSHFQSWDQLDAFACCVGPGGFTGVRVAVAYVQGLSMASQVPCIAVNSLEAMAAEIDGNDWPAEQRLWLALDARMDELYVAAFEWRDGTWVMDGEMQLLAASTLAGQMGSNDLIAGPGFENYQNAFSQQLLPDVRLSARGVARCARRRGLDNSVLAPQLQPIYLRNKVAKTLKERGL